jgi:succinate dehydrogenase cytochrome b556 subunit
MSSLRLTLVEAVRYRGHIGHYSWIAHRLTGLAILSFLIIHVWDTANAAFWPELYDYTVQIFKWFPFSVLEIGLMGTILFHAFNGTRITLLDFKPAWWKYQQSSARFVWALFAVVFLIVGGLMFSTTLGHCQTLAAEGGSCFAFPLPEEALGTNTTLFIMFGVALLVGVGAWFVLRGRPEPGASQERQPKQFGSQLERYGYLFMRLSGISLLLLAVGHMFLQHVFRDVHALSLTVVAEVWRDWGWRAYDLFLLAFAATHGMNGLRNVLEDYVHDPKKVRGINLALAIFLVITIIWAGVAIFTFQPDASLAQVQ